MASAGHGHAGGRSLAIAFLRPEAAAAGTQLDASLLGGAVPARILPEAPFDPRNERLRRALAAASANGGERTRRAPVTGLTKEDRQ